MTMTLRKISMLCRQHVTAFANRSKWISVWHVAKWFRSINSANLIPIVFWLNSIVILSNTWSNKYQCDVQRFLDPRTNCLNESYQHFGESFIQFTVIGHGQSGPTSDARLTNMMVLLLLLPIGMYTLCWWCSFNCCCWCYICNCCAG